MSKSLIKLGLIAAVIIFLASMVNFVIRASTSDNYPVTVMINDIVQYLTQAITIVLVAAPEGLSLVITMSLAYSVSLMKNDGLLIKELKVPERSARIQEILIGKTGTLTTGDLKVANFYICGVDRENQRNNSLYNVKIPNHALDLIEDSIIYNTEARMEIND
jgi:Ca2+-transporting ATPase